MSCFIFSHILLLAFSIFIVYVNNYQYISNDFKALIDGKANGSKMSRIVEWTSFQKRFRETPEELFQPTTREEIIQIVKEAIHNKKSVKVVGSGHSWSPIGMTDGYLINLDKYQKIIKVNSEKRQVTVEAGIRIADLSEFLSRNYNLSLQNTGVINCQALAGALATGTHGTGIKFPLLSASIVDVEIILADGEVIKVGQDSESLREKKIFEAARINLGAIGIISQITMQCVKEYKIVRTFSSVPLANSLESLPNLLQLNDHLMIWWIPYSDNGIMMAANRTDSFNQAHSKENMVSADIFSFYYNKIVAEMSCFGMKLLEVSTHLVTYLSSRYTPFFNRNIISPMFHYFSASNQVEYFEKGYEGLIVPQHPMQYNEMEYFLPQTNFSSAFNDFQDYLNTQDSKNNLGANFIVQLRWTAQDDIWMSPFNKEDKIYVGIATLIKTVPCEKYFHDVEKIWLYYGGRPHWGKQHGLNKKQMVAIYGENFNQFNNIRIDLDPKGVFMNDHLRYLFEEVEENDVTPNSKGY